MDRMIDLDRNIFITKKNFDEKSVCHYVKLKKDFVQQNKSKLKWWCNVHSIGWVYEAYDSYVFENKSDMTMFVFFLKTDFFDVDNSQ